ncbi:MAG: hypothetical protein A2107_01385 [Verrucomicrobia bacterium GWF2_62_7]|nr:MAG: hypothetical protein A2107_01385 [Verrucomicrobia bacterium GWF2_62_7]
MALILTMCSIAVDAPARLPRPYENHGVVQFVDVANRKLYLAETPKPKSPLGQIVKPIAFVWTDQTVFFLNSIATNCAAARVGVTVGVFYYFPSRGTPCMTRVVVAETRAPRQTGK